MDNFQQRPCMDKSDETDNRDGHCETKRDSHAHLALLSARLRIPINSPEQRASHEETRANKNNRKMPREWLCTPRQSLAFAILRNHSSLTESCRQTRLNTQSHAEDARELQKQESRTPLKISIATTLTC